MRQEGLKSGCIGERGLSALQYLHAAPVCSRANFLYWEPCEHEALREVRHLLQAHLQSTTAQDELDLIEFHPRDPSPQSLGQRIMVIDHELENLGSWRYRSRVLDVLMADEEGTYRSRSPTGRISKVLKEIIELLESRFPLLSPKSLVGVEETLHKLLARHETVYPATHGMRIVNHLAEYNPKAEFVLAGFVLDPIEDLCSMEPDGKIVDRVRQKTRNLAKSLVEQIQKYDINFVNMSFGKVIRERLNHEKCRHWPSAFRIKELNKIYLEEFFFPLSNLPNVAVVQAGVSAPFQLRSLKTLRNTCANHSPLEAGFENVSNAWDLFDYEPLRPPHSDYLTDCVALSNRLRVGKISTSFPKVPALGTNDIALIDDPEFLNAVSCTDVFLNEGIEVRRGASLRAPSKEERTFVLWESVNGVETEPVFLTSSSQIAPVAISYMLALKRENPSLSPKALLEIVKQRAKIQDPLRYELHPLNVFGSPDFQT